MSRRRAVPFLLAGLPFALLVLSACFQDSEGPYSGTATTTGNTISGRVLPSVGAPSPARVALSNREYQPGFQGPALQAPPKAIRFEGETDSLGNFHITVSPGYSYVLEASTHGETPLVQWRENILVKNDGDSLHLDTLIIRPAATLQGHLFSPSDDGDSSRTLWVGYLGTGSFTRVDPEGAFRLGGLPPGSRTLTLLRDRKRPLGWSRETFHLEGVALQEGLGHILDSLFLPEAPVQEPLKASACLETPGVLVPATAFSSHGKASARFRTLRADSSLALVELDICAGTWRTVMNLPSDPRAMFSDSTRDLALLPGRKEILKIDPGTGAYQSFPYAFEGGNMEFNAGRFFVLTESDTTLRVFPSEAAFLANSASQSWKWPYPFRPKNYDFSVVESGVYYLLETDKLELYFLDLEDPRAPKTSAPMVLQGFTGTFRGFAGGTDGTVWILNSANELYRYRVDRPLWIQKLRIASPFAVRGLTRFP